MLASKIRQNNKSLKKYMIVYAALVGITFNKNHFKSITRADQLAMNRDLSLFAYQGKNEA